MQVFIVMFIVWAVVTVVGHGSWVAVRGFFRIFSSDRVPSHRNTLPDEKSDIAAMRRVLGRMANKNLLDESIATEIRDQLRKLEAPPLAPMRPPIAAVEDEPILAALTDQTPPAAVLTTAPPRQAPAPLSPQAVAPPVFAAKTGATAPMPQPTPLALSKSEVIQAFLAAHNIRWGELVAGLLIVVCSIGLVISLWSPLVETHRVLPSLIFLGANAAIYAAGLYTLSRWRLRHTSRAVLVIATLLVPLSVLAGLAAAGTSREAVQLTDPITVGAIALAGAVYVVLLYLGGKALSRRWYAVPMVIAVAGPVLTLPLVPASVRAFGAHAGWITGIGSMAILLASLQMVRLRRRLGASIGRGGARARLLVMGFGAFSLAVAIGYAAFALRDDGLTATLSIAVAAVPALIALAGSSRLLMTSARSSTQSMTGAVLCVILIGLAWTVLPVSMISASWLWSWAVVFSLSAAAVGWLFRQPRWLALATLPVGMAAMFSSPVWLGQESWVALPFWKRIIGGEPMLAASMVAILVMLASRLVRSTDQRTSIGYAAVCWAAVAVSIAAALSVAPVAAIGIAPVWSVTCVLVVGVVVSVLLATRHHVWSMFSIGSTVFAWLSVLRPIRWNTSLGSPTLWMITAVAIAATLLAFREIMPRLALPLPRNRRTIMRSAKHWELASNVSSIAAAVIACFSARHDWTAAAATLVAVSVLLFWLSKASRSINLLRISQAATVALAVVLGYGWFEPWLFAKEAWMTAVSIWAWSIVAGVVALLWVLIRQVATLNLPNLGSVGSRRFGFLASKRAAPVVMPDGWLAATATGLACLGSAWAFASLLASASGSDLVADESPLLLPATSLATCGVVAGWMQRMRLDRALPVKLASAIVIAGIVWGSSQFADAIPSGAATKLIVATTLAAAVCYSISTWNFPRFDSPLSKQVYGLSTFVAPVLVAISSVVLLRTSWFEPLTVPTYAQAFPTLVVAGWWMTAAAALLWNSKRTLTAATSVLSAVLAPAAAALVVPVFAVSHPAVWMQVAASASVIWITVTRLWLTEKEASVVRAAVEGSMLFAVVVAVASSLYVTFSILFDVDMLRSAFGPAGFVISVLGVILWCTGWVRLSNRTDGLTTPMPWPVGLSLMAGQFAWLASSFNWVSGIEVVELTTAILCIASAASWIRSRSNARPVDFSHVAVVSVLIAVVAGIVGNRSDWMPWLALGGLVIGGLQVTFVGRAANARQPLLGATRLLGWFVIAVGGMFLVIRIASGTSPPVRWTLLVVWSAVWVVTWRLICPDKRGQVEHRYRALLAIPDPELATVLMIAVISETILFTLSGRHSFQTVVVADPLLWVRVVAYVLVSISTVARAGRDAIWSIAIGTLVAAASLVSVQVAIELGASPNQRFVWAALPSGFAIAFLAHWIPALARLLARFADGSAASHLGRLVQSTWQVALAVAWLGGLAAVVMIVGGAPAADTNLAIIAVALAAWAIAEMAEACNGPRLRHAAVTVALVTIGLWASVDSGETSHPALTATMRWLVASVFTIPMLMFVFPKLLGENLASRWREAFQRGAVVAAVAAGCSLVSMLVMEATLRTQAGIAGISLPMVVGVALTLAALSVLAALIAILSGPGSSWRDRVQLSEQQRRVLIVMAQSLGGITWLHLFLCKTDWAFVGLRDYWPFIVMGLAFLSVGATEWARRRGDTVMSQTLSQTALYLPLVPVVGFWLSGLTDEFSWAFRGGHVRYDLLLALGSVYYIAISAMWKGIMPRISAIVLGNAAWWVVLVQSPQWSFLGHPQVWLIPPALCVLVATHLYRERLQPVVASAIRYASTLLIYLSSTADMLLQQIGTTLAGPIILVLLALAGMAAGVVLRVRPFLYLGAMFVFLGVTSMVWHAHRAFDAVWPWWVFGITTGICLLAGLMAIEKNKPKLRQYAQRLATWQG